MIRRWETLQLVTASQEALSNGIIVNWFTINKLNSWGCNEKTTNGFRDSNFTSALIR